MSVDALASARWFTGSAGLALPGTLLSRSAHLLHKKQNSCNHESMAVALDIQTRDVILDATDRLMARYGFRKTSIDDIAREAGISRRTVYVHFKNKEDVGLSSIGRVVENVHTELESILQNTDLEPHERLRRMLVRRVLGRIEQIQDYKESLDELFEVVRPAYMARREEYFRRENHLIVRALEPFGESGEVAESLLLATNAFLPYSLSVDELGARHVIERRLNIMVDLLLRGIGPKTTG